MVVNHVSFLDGALLMAALSELPVFAINTAMANRWWLRPFRKVANLYPLDPTNPLAIKDADRQDQRRPALRDLPRGPAQRHRRVDEDLCRPGLHRRPDRGHDPAGAPRRARADARSAGSSRARSPATGSPRSPSPSARRGTLDGRSRRCAARPAARSPTCSSTTSCRTWCSSTTDWGPTLFAALLRARWRHGWRYPVLEDTSGVHIDYMKLVAGALVLGPQVRRHHRARRAGRRAGPQRQRRRGRLLRAAGLRPRAGDAQLLGRPGQPRGRRRSRPRSGW